MTRQDDTHTQHPHNPTLTVAADVAFVVFAPQPASGPSSGSDALGSSGSDSGTLQTVPTWYEQAEAIVDREDQEQQRQRDRAAVFGAQRAVLRREQRASGQANLRYPFEPSLATFGSNPRRR